MSKKTLCLVMIVRNESKVIKRALDRVKDKIDYWVIVDTGSDDNTIEIIQETLKHIPGELHQEKWVNFGFNRTQSLQFAKGKADYLLLCDADEQIIFSPEFNVNELTEAGYLISYIGTNDYAVPYLIKGDLNWRYVGVTHEYLDCDVAVTRKKITTLSILDLKDGGFKADKFERDVRLLEQGLIEEPNNSRYKFYLANSYRDMDNYAKAAEWYEKRIADLGWIEEVTVAYENLGKCYEYLEGGGEKALNTWLMGYDYNPNRMECLYNAVRLLRCNEKYRLAYQLGMIAKSIEYPVNDILFVKRDVYEFWLYYELSICAYYANDFKLGYECCKKILFASPDFHILETTINNLCFYKEYAVEDSKEHIQQLVQIVGRYFINHRTTNAEQLLVYLTPLAK